MASRTLSDLLAAANATPQGAPRPPPMPVRTPGGGTLRLDPAAGLPTIPTVAPPQPPPLRVLGGGRLRRPSPPRAIPGGVPGPAKGPQVPGAPQVPQPKPGAAPGAPPAPKVVTVPPSAFADTWRLKPKAPIEIGIRLIADADFDKARTHAAKIAAEVPDPDARIEAYNEALMQWAVARATCKPENAQEDFWRASQDVVPIALTDDGLTLLFHELQNLKIEQSPLIGEAKDAELEELGKLLQAPNAREILLTLGEPRLRRHLRWLLDEVRATVGPGHIPTPVLDGEVADPGTFPTGPVG